MLNIASIHDWNSSCCVMTTVLDVVGHSYRLHQDNCFVYMNDRTWEMIVVAVCNTEYELFCEVGAIWLLHQHCMQQSHQQPYDDSKSMTYVSRQQA
jgi:hypothetical protein